MGNPSTPLGFVPGEVDAGAHCMFVYPKRDGIFFDRVSSYLKAGLDAGEMCVCVCTQTDGSIHSHMRALGVDADAALRSGQLSFRDADSIYTSDEGFDMRRVMAFWEEKTESARKHWHGIRIFGDGDYALGSRTNRLKMLEYESKVNLASSRITIALCGYQSSTVPRTLMTQMKNVHPFIANARSIQRNHRYVEPSRFLSTFYRFQRVSRVYPATPQNGQDCRRHFEETAARTPMTTAEILDMKLALGEAFNNAVQHGCAGLPEHRRHVHVCFLPQAVGFSVEVRDHGPGFAAPPDDESVPHDQPGSRGFHLMRSLVQDVHVGRRDSDTVVSLYTAYSTPFSD